VRDSGICIRLRARNEGLECRVGGEVYRFAVRLQGREWTLFLPGTKGERFEPHELDRDEELRILPALVAYLSRIRWFGIFPRSYAVLVKRGEKR
jgi:hypothetical protein